MDDREFLMKAMKEQFEQIKQDLKKEFNMKINEVKESKQVIKQSQLPKLYKQNHLMIDGYIIPHTSWISCLVLMFCKWSTPTMSENVGLCFATHWIITLFILIVMLYEYYSLGVFSTKTKGE